MFFFFPITAIFKFIVFLNHHFFLSDCSKDKLFLEMFIIDFFIFIQCYFRYNMIHFKFKAHGYVQWSSLSHADAIAENVHRLLPSCRVTYSFFFFIDVHHRVCITQTRAGRVSNEKTVNRVCQLYRISYIIRHVGFRNFGLTGRNIAINTIII